MPENKISESAKSRNGWEMTGIIIMNGSNCKRNCSAASKNSPRTLEHSQVDFGFNNFAEELQRIKSGKTEKIQSPKDTDTKSNQESRTLRSIDRNVFNSLSWKPVEPHTDACKCTMGCVSSKKNKKSVNQDARPHVNMMFIFFLFM